MLYGRFLPEVDFTHRASKAYDCLQSYAIKGFMTLTQILVPTYCQMLKALSNWLGKAGSDDEILSAQLAPDMFPLSTQVRFSCLQAFEGVAWLRGEAFPPIWHTLLEEGRNGRDNPGSLEDAKLRITQAVGFLDTLGPTELDAGADRAIELKLPDGRIFDMTGEEYVRDWAIPQLYFHIMTAYSILRLKGVDLGKADYVEHAFAYLRGRKHS